MLQVRMLLVAAFAVMLSGCSVNQYAEFYKPFDAGHPYGNGPAFAGTPQVVKSSGNLNEDTARLYADGYGPIGQSSFNGALDTPDDAAKQAILVHASHVVLWNKYASTESGVMPMTTPTSATGYTSGSVGNTSYYGTTTVYGTETTYIPYQVQRFDQIANFYAPLPRAGLGVMLNDVPTELKQKIGSNYGRYVISVRRESPAFKANIVPGDVIMSINDASITSDSDAIREIRSAAGKELKVTFWRLGETKTIGVVVPASW